jgi:hypothetical protein
MRAPARSPSMPLTRGDTKMPGRIARRPARRRGPAPDPGQGASVRHRIRTMISMSCRAWRAPGEGAGHAECRVVPAFIDAGRRASSSCALASPRRYRNFLTFYHDTINFSAICSHGGSADWPTRGCEQGCHRCVPRGGEVTYSPPRNRIGSSVTSSSGTVFLPPVSSRRFFRRQSFHPFTSRHGRRKPQDVSRPLARPATWRGCLVSSNNTSIRVA